MFGSSLSKKTSQLVFHAKQTISRSFHAKRQLTIHAVNKFHAIHANYTIHANANQGNHANNQANNGNRAQMRGYHSSPSYSLLSHRSLILVEGKDSVSFLQGLTTNNMKNLLPSQMGMSGIYTFFLNHKGRAICDAFVYVKEKESETPSLIIEVDKNMKESLMKHLQMFKLRIKVNFKDISEEYDTWSTWGITPGAEFHWNMFANIGCKDSRHEEMGFRMIFEKSKKPELPSSFKEVTNQEYTVHRILNGVAEGSQDIIPNQSFPLESNLDFMNGVSFDKGCYLGQELTAQTYHRGVTRKRILPVQFFKPGDAITDKPTPEVDYEFQCDIAAGTPIFQSEQAQVSSKVQNGNGNTSGNGTNSTTTATTVTQNSESSPKPVGEVGSHIYNIGLALVRLGITENRSIQMNAGKYIVKAFPPRFQIK